MITLTYRIETPGNVEALAAKIASDQNKPDGMCVIRPGEGAEFVARLPIRRFHGVGPKGAEKMAGLGIETGGDLAERDIEWLRGHFGSFADYLYRAARGIDLRPVRSSRIRKSVGGERTFSRDLSSGSELRETMEDIIDIVWGYIERAEARGRTVTLKMKYTDFQIFSRAKTMDHPIADKKEFATIGRALLEEVLPLPMPIRLMGLTLSKLEQDGEEEGQRPDAQLSLL